MPATVGVAAEGALEEIHSKAVPVDERTWPAVPHKSAQSRINVGLMAPLPSRARPPEIIEETGNDIVIPQMWMRK
jgi:hypothetical protein